MDPELLYKPVEDADAWLGGLFDHAPLGLALVVAFLMGLRHASDPDHLVAVTSLVAADDGDTRAATRIGAWWGVGHAGTLLAVGLPLILLKAELPGWFSSAAERVVGAVIVLLALRVLSRWLRGHYRRDAGAHVRVRTSGQALAIGTLHGLAGTGSVVLLLVAALPTQLGAAAALAVFAPMSVASMALCTSAFAWLLTRPALEPLYASVFIPAVGAFGLLFGTAYIGGP
jgi:hypothetical protein